ncbi:MAG: hypothetical protein JJ866_01665 [Roseibium sp.]|uniref:hypothetical protein n=1 Tax=Roseibium sp. TaxID=1936156 RepID=UPI001B051A00|nr:hypothetical protein [Roseibium sp.]MBO6510696.1 hypothetical protein [Roseibium sp.]MBO6890622.1 hypothetical protein [Roseibium sp.]MBO6930115.1 hypothetical protein [Roseibium sp.]
MKSILVAMHLVACQPDLLICQDMSVNAKRWADMDTCRKDRDAEMRRTRDMLPEHLVVMSRCRYLIGRDRRSLPMF